MRILASLTALALGLWLAAAAGAEPAVPESAYGEAAVENGEPRVEARLLVESENARPGEALRVGVLLSLDRGWHVYWRNSGQSGIATQLDWKIDGASVGPIEWPFPSVFREADGFITTYGYAKQVLLLSEARFAPDAREGEAQVAVDANFLVCEVQCIPGEAKLSRSVHVSNADALPDPEMHALFEEWSARVPRAAGTAGVELEAVYSLSAIRPGDTFRAAVAAREQGGGLLEAGTDDPANAFVPDRVGGIELLVTGARRPEFLAGGLLLSLDGRASTDPPKDAAGRLRGVLALERAAGPAYVEVDLPLPRAAAGADVAALSSPWLEAPPPDPALAVPFWRALLLALAGGLILNLMPCVLPVLALKVFAIPEIAHRDRAGVVRHGIAYLAGVLVTMSALALAVVALRAAGTSVGWGFQFQEPLFVAAISAVLVVFALNLFGVFEIGFDATALANAGAQATGARRSFFEGLLAVVLATPCSAPFLGTAIGFAFASPAPTIVAIFLAIGAGLAAPFVLVTLIPGLARFVPRSGAWMLHLRTGLGFALLGTVVWLLWIMGRGAGAGAQTALLAYLLVLAAGVWAYGLLQRAERTHVARAAALSLALLAALGLAALPVAEARPVSEAEDAGAKLASAPFSREAVSAALASGRPVFVYFTADWCLTCKVNEHAVLSDTRVARALADENYVTLIGDWTRRDETIRAELARFGKAGVPLYLVYSPSAPDRPAVLPELLTVDLFLNALHAAAPEKERST
jgi:thiol:disulfide interchange protein DsbD